jgi:cytosine/adenosine deaminase-related metal-dependent hydrolase
MLLTGTVVADSRTVIEDGAVVVDGDRIAAVGQRAALAEQYADREQRAYDLLLPGFVGGHIHSVQSLGRGIADDTELLDWLFDYVLPMEASLSAAEMEVAHADRAFEAAGELGIRGVLGKVLMDQRSPDALREDTEAALAESERLIRQYHGAFGDRIRYAVTPRFAVSCTEACLRGARELADAYDGVRIHTHASENRSEIETVEAETGLRNIHWLDEVGLTGEDVVLAHCVWTDESEREVLAETGTHVTHCPSSNMKLASGVAPIEDYLERGINVALGNDGAPCNNTLDPLTEMRQASLLQKVDQLEPTATPARTIFEMATVNGAKAAGFEKLGALREGWTADVIGLDTDLTRAVPLHDVFSHLVFAAHGDDVQFTMVDGEVLMDDGEVTVVDADEIRRRGSEIGLSLDLDAEREAAQEQKP